MILRILRRRIRKNYGSARYLKAHPFAKQSSTGTPEDRTPRAPGLKGVRHLDPLGPVRASPTHKTYERLLPEESWHHAQMLNDSHAVKTLCDDGLLNPFTLSETYFERSLQADARALTSNWLPVDIPFDKRPLELDLRMAENWLEMNEALLVEGLGLLDAHDGNFAFDGWLRPVWIDHGSLVHVHSPDLALREFLETRLLPTSLRVRNPALGELIRGKRVSWMAYWEMRPFTGSLLALGLGLSRFLSVGVRGLQREDQDSRRSRDKGGSTSSMWRVWLRRIILVLLRLSVDRLRRRARESGFWSDYRPPSTDSSYAVMTDRDRAIISTAASLEWTSCADIGANDGHHVLALATTVEAGRHFTAVEPDDFALSKFVRSVEAARLPHTFAAHLGSLFSDSDSADLLLALALTHHLALQQHYPLDAIAARLALRSRKYCIVEFMPMGLTTTEQLLAAEHRTPPDWYSEENFVQAMTRHFQHVSEIHRTYFGDSDASHRVAFLATHA